MTPAQLKELKKLCAEATPLTDWRTGVDSYADAGSSFWWARMFTENRSTEQQAECDAAFIAAARAAVPELIAEVERLTDELGELADAYRVGLEDGYLDGRTAVVRERGG